MQSGLEQSSSQGTPSRKRTIQTDHTGHKKTQSPLDRALAEKEGFEPPVPLQVHLISSQAHSTTLALLRAREDRQYKRDCWQFQLQEKHQLGTMPFALHSERLNLDGQQELERPILFFDGECVLCNRTVQWLLRHERHGELQFAALNSQTAQARLGGTRFEAHADSILLLDPSGQLYAASDAAFRTLPHLKAGWQVLNVLMVFPRFLRKPVYHLIARNRKRWFGSTDHCALLTGVDSSRLLQ